MTERRCQWHECGAPFEPLDPRQKYCSRACQRARGQWTQRRGAPLVEAILRLDAKAIVAQRRRIIKEVEDAILRRQ